MPAITAQEQADLTALEEAMWMASTRYDAAFQAACFAEDFVEFGRSGAIYAREQIVLAAANQQDILEQLPLDNLQFRRLDVHTVLLTYNSLVQVGAEHLHARRSSVWTWQGDPWVMRFHQGTPYLLGASGQ